MMTDKQKLESLLRHLDNVQENAKMMADKLIERGQLQFGLALYANSFIHDNSKFRGIEWEFLDPQTSNRTGLKNAINQHAKTNPHHPEYWDGIGFMPDIYIAEMVCDWKARSTEFGTSVREWIDTEATKKYKFTKESTVYGKIMFYLNLICDAPFVPVEEEARIVRIMVAQPEEKNVNPTQTNQSIKIT